MKSPSPKTIGRRDLIVKTVPACAAACLGLARVPGLAGAANLLACQEVHKFDAMQDFQFSTRQLVGRFYRGVFLVIDAMREELGDAETIRILNVSSAEDGRQRGLEHAQAVPDTSFENFTAIFRQMIAGNGLTGEIVEDTEGVFALRMTECISAEVCREAGLDGEIGHAAVCNMDYTWPTAFNPDFKMERTKTLMQGDDCCNHRYINTAAE